MPYEEDERILGHAADPYHRIDIRQASRNLVVRHRDQIIADTKRPVVLYEPGFAPRWYVLRVDIDESALTPMKLQTLCRIRASAAITPLMTHVRRRDGGDLPTPARIPLPARRSASSK